MQIISIYLSLKWKKTYFFIKFVSKQNNINIYFTNLNHLLIIYAKN